MIKSVMVRSPEKEIKVLDKRIERLENRLTRAMSMGPMGQLVAWAAYQELKWLRQRREHMARMISG